MPSFRDAAGREWPVAITVADLKPVREATGVKLGDLADPAKLGELLADPERLVDVVWALVKGQRADVTPEQFGRSLSGDAVEALADAFVGALADFFPSRTRAVLTALVRKAKAATELAAAEALAELNRPPTPGSDAPGSSPGSADSTPAP